MSQSNHGIDDDNDNTNDNSNNRNNIRRCVDRQNLNVPNYVSYPYDPMMMLNHHDMIRKKDIRKYRGKISM